MALERVRQITIDFQLPTSLPVPRFVQYDTNVLEFIIKDGGTDADLTDVQRIVLNLRRKDGVLLQKLLTAEGNVLRYQLTDEDMMIDGYVDVTLQFYHTDDHTTTAELKIYLQKTLTNEFANNKGLPLLEQLFIEVSHTNEYAIQTADMVVRQVGEKIVELDGFKEILQTDLSNKVDTETFNAELEKKADKETVNAALADKANIFMMQELSQTVNTKADTTYVETELGKKADTTELETKADQEEVNMLGTQLADTSQEIEMIKTNKADKEYVDTALANKADATTVQGLSQTVNAKADTEYVETELAKKADTTALETKADVTALETKADKEEVNTLSTQLAETTTKAETHSNIPTPKSVTVSANKGVIPYITFVDDDGFVEYYTKLAPLLESKGFRGVTAVVTSNIGKPENMSVDNLKELHEKGHEIASHTHDHLPFGELTIDEIEYQLKTSKEKILSWGLPVTNFIYPFGQTGGKEGRYKVSKYYKTAFTAGSANNNDQNKNLVNNSSLHRVSADTETLENLKLNVDNCLNNGTWLVFMLHSNTLSQERFNVLGELMDYINSKGIPVGTIEDALGIFGNSFTIEGKKYLKFLGDGDVESNAIGAVFKSRKEGYDIDLSTPLSFFESDKITYSLFTVEDNIPFPESKEGVLETHHLSPVITLAHQKWKPYNSTNVYVRDWKGTVTDGSWGEFKPIGVVDQFIPSDIPYDDINGNIVLSNINASSYSGYPTYGFGITFKTKGGKGYNKQIFSPYNSNRLYLRTFKSDGTLTEFTEFSPKPIKLSVITPEVSFLANETKVLDIDLSSISQTLTNRTAIIATCRSSQVDNLSYNIRIASDTTAKLRLTNLKSEALSVFAMDWDITIVLD